MEGWTYAKAGVDLRKHRSMHERALEMMSRLARELDADVGGLGGYASWIRVGGRKLVLHIDGVGTKSIIAAKLGNYEVIGWDCVAMNVNDVACEGAIPKALVDYIAMPESSEEVFEGVFRGVLSAAEVSKVAVLGGETAILPNLVNSIDAVCVVLAEKSVDFTNRAEVGDVVIGFRSSGIHANGYSLVRRVLESTVGYEAVVDGVSLPQELLKPVIIYSNFTLEAIQRRLINSAAHVTGGAFTKLKRVLGKGADMVLEVPEPHPIFKVIMKLGNVPVSEMYRVFNMGVGLVVTAPKGAVSDVLDLASKYGHEAQVIGEVKEGSGKVFIRTPWGDELEF